MKTLENGVVEVKGDMAAQTTEGARAMTAVQILQASAGDIQRRVDEHQRLMAMALEGGDFKSMLNACSPLDCPHRLRFRETLVDAISVLEDTRKSFKSKQLEVLRKKLIGALAEHA